MEVVPDTVAAVMRRLEDEDRRDRVDGTPQARRLRQIPPEVGRFLHTLVVAIGARSVLEIGTSGGYSTLWLALAVRSTGGRVTTFEVDAAKVERARATFERAGGGDVIELRHADAVGSLDATDGSVDLAFLDAEKDVYVALLEPLVRALRPGGVLIADNLVSHEEQLAGFRDAALSHRELSGLVVPIGRGELVAVKAR